MTTPTVTETAVNLQAVTRDDFADTLAGAWPQSQRALVALSLLRCPSTAAERRP